MSKIDAGKNRSPLDLLKFAGGWALFSFTTALAISAILMNAGAATPSDIWAVLVGLYRGIASFIFGGLASLIPFHWFEITQEDSDCLAAIALVTIPLYALFGRGGLAGFLLIYLVIFIGFGVNFPTVPSLLGISFQIWMVLVVFAGNVFIAWRDKQLWRYMRNFVGAGVILVALMATGFFEIQGLDPGSQAHNPTVTPADP